MMTLHPLLQTASAPYVRPEKKTFDVTDGDVIILVSGGGVLPYLFVALDHVDDRCRALTRDSP